MVKLINKDEYENRIKKLCEGTIYSFIGWVGEYKGSRTYIWMKCEKHGDWSVKVNHFLNVGSRCAKCRNEKCGDRQRISQKKREEQIKELCEGTIYSFVRWDGEYKNSQSKFICKCEEHGEWSTGVNSFVLSDGRCFKCRNEKIRVNKTLPREEREGQIKELCEGTIYSFVRWDGSFKDSKTHALMSCEKHGNWLVTFNNFSRGHGCPSCAVTGYKSQKKGTLYCLRSECGQFVKIGISNKHEQRFMQLRHSTPFDFHIVELFTNEDGMRVREWEKLFHQSFESANLTGFNGCTEWLKWDPKITEWFRFIN